jgi:hypothetical protein
LPTKSDRPPSALKSSERRWRRKVSILQNKKTRAGFSARFGSGAISSRPVVLVQEFAKAVIARVMAADAAKMERIAVSAFMFHLPETL